MTTTTTTAVNTTSSPLHYHFDTVEHDHILDMNSRLLLSSSNMNNNATTSSSSSSSSFSYFEKYYTTSFDHLTKSQQTANMVILRCSAILSILGSSYIIYNLLGPRRKTELNKRMFSRLLLLCLSISDVCSSIVLFLGTWPIPKEVSDNDLYYNFYNTNIGTITTCNIQGLLLQIFYFTSIFLYSIIYQSTFYWLLNINIQNNIYDNMSKSIYI